MSARSWNIWIIYFFAVDRTVGRCQTWACKAIFVDVWPGVEVTKPISSVALYFQFSLSSKHWLVIEYRVHIWPVLLHHSLYFKDIATRCHQINRVIQIHTNPSPDDNYVVQLLQYLAKMVIIFYIKDSRRHIGLMGNVCNSFEKWVPRFICFGIPMHVAMGVRY